MVRASLVARKVDAARAAGHNVHTRHTNHRTSLVLGGVRGVVLMASGELTAAGRHYERVTGQSLQRPPDWQGSPFIVGHVTWVKVAGRPQKCRQCRTGARC